MKRILAAVLLLFTLTVAPRVEAACALSGTSLGINISPRGASYGYSFFGAINGTDWHNGWISDKSFLQPELRTELAIMASMGVKYVRLMAVPFLTGYSLNGNSCFSNSAGCSNGGLLNSFGALDQTITNLTGVTIGGNISPAVSGDPVVGIIPLFASYGIKVILAMGNNGNIWGPDSFWYDAYGNNINGWHYYTADSVYWVNRLVAGIEATSAKNNVLYYDLQNENYYFNPLKNGTSNDACGDTSCSVYYTRALLTGVAAPTNRRGMSSLNACAFSRLAADASAVSKPLSFVESHDYPLSHFRIDSSCGTDDQNFTAKLGLLSAQFPQACLIAGEFASEQCDRITVPNVDNSEDTQAKWDKTTIASAAAAGAVVTLHWGFIGKWAGAQPIPEFGKFCQNAPSKEFGYELGFDINTPRHTYGMLTDLATGGNTDTPGAVNLINGGGDFENTNHFQGLWTGTGTDFAKIRVGPDPSQAAAGYYYAHTNAHGNSEICTPWAALTGQTRASVSGYIRSDVAKGNLTVRLEYTLQGGVSGSLTQAVSGVRAKDFLQIQALVPNATTPTGFIFTLPANADGMRACFGGAVAAGCGSTKMGIDLDAMSMNAWTPL